MEEAGAPYPASGRSRRKLDISERVWKYTDECRREIELGLDEGIRSGEGVAKMARSLKQYLKEPERLYRRVRTRHGRLRLSKAAAAYHPGRGVYRSSWRNARRLAITETNMAYLEADYERYSRQDFVVGVRVCLSGNHTCLGADGKPHRFTDICDALAGDYPKDFKFTGWHPQCRCHVEPILKTPEEMKEDRRRMEAGGEPAPAEESANYVGAVPENFRKWIRENAGRISEAEKRGTLPYFITDNRTVVDKALKPEARKPEVRKDPRRRTALEIAAERHAARTPEEIERIQERWNQNRLEYLMQLSERIGGFGDKTMSELFAILKDDNALSDFKAFRADYKAAKKYINEKIEAETALVRKMLKEPEMRTNLLEVAKALGVDLSDPMTFHEADELKGNPNYHASEGYRVNCQTCVVAYELRCRGLDIEALANTKGSWLDKLSRNTNEIWRDAAGNIPEKTLVGARSIDYISYSGARWKEYEKTVTNRKQLIKELEASLTEDGRYHIDWTWNSRSKTCLPGHIITVEKTGDTIRYYDPQNGKVITDFYDYIKNIQLKRGINVLRVDNLRVDADYAAHILCKSGSKTTGGKAAKGGVRGGITPKTDKEGFKALQKQTKQSAKGYTKEIRHNKDLFYTQRMVINRDALQAMIGHAYTEVELNAIQKLPECLERLSNPRYDPLKISRPNIRKKIESGAKHFVEYDIEIDGVEFTLKTKAVKDTHSNYLVEHPYFFREKR